MAWFLTRTARWMGRIAPSGIRLGDRCRTAEIQCCSEEAAVDAIIFEILINPDEILITIAEVAGVEDAAVNDWK